MTCFHTAFTLSLNSPPPSPLLTLTLVLATPMSIFNRNGRSASSGVRDRQHKNKENKLAWSCQMKLMLILFFVNSERTVLLSVKCDLDPFFTTLFMKTTITIYVTNKSLEYRIHDIFIVQSFRIVLYYWVCHSNEQFQ